MKVTIGGITYQIKFVEATPGEVVGAIDYNQNIIFIEKHEIQRVWETILHEIIHAILYNAGYEEHDERLVGALSHGLMALLRQNKELIQEFYRQIEEGKHGRA